MPSSSALRLRGWTLAQAVASQAGVKTHFAGRLPVFDRDEVLSRLRQVQAIVTHLERHPRMRAEAAARRAQQTGDHSYRGVKATLILGLDLLTAPGMPR